MIRPSFTTERIASYFSRPSYFLTTPSPIVRNWTQEKFQTLFFSSSKITTYIYTLHCCIFENWNLFFQDIERFPSLISVRFLVFARYNFIRETSNTYFHVTIETKRCAAKRKVQRKLSRIGRVRKFRGKFPRKLCGRLKRVGWWRRQQCNDP